VEQHLALPGGERGTGEVSAALDTLLRELRQHAGWENTSGATTAAERIAALPGDEPVRALLEVLREADEVDLTDDAGDLGDEVHRLRAGAHAGLVACGARAILLMRPLVRVELREPRHAVMIRALAALGELSITPILEAWCADEMEEQFFGRLAAIEAVGLLKPPDASMMLRAVLTRPGTQNQGWLKRTTAHALGRIGDVDALEVLLDDADWYARLGVAEALKSLPAERAARLLARVRVDVDQRVREG
jgi:HEAT repeat protein